MIYLHRVIVEDSEITWKIYWFNPGILSHRRYVKKIQNEIYKVFPNETYSWDESAHQCFGYNLKDNMIITNICGSHEGSLDKNKHYKDLLDQSPIFFDKDFICFMYDLDNKTKSYEVYYKSEFPESFPETVNTIPFDDKVKLGWVAEYYNDKFERTGQNLFVIGNIIDVYEWIDKQNSGLKKPLPINTNLDDGEDGFRTKNAFKCEYDNEGNLINLRFFGCVKRSKMKKKGKFSHLELSCEYASSINNLEQTEIVETNYDESGNRIPSEIIKRIDDYIFFPKARENGEYERVLLKDM